MRYRLVRIAAGREYPVPLPEIIRRPWEVVDQAERAGPGLYRATCDEVSLPFAIREDGFADLDAETVARLMAAEDAVPALPLN